MGKIKQQMETKAELSLMGKYIPVETEDEVRFITSYILTVLGKEDIDPYDYIHRFNSGNTVEYIGVNTLQGMPCITYCLDAEDAPEPFTEDYGSGYPASFCYVYNPDYPACSEFGDCFFEKQGDNYYHRVS